MTIGEKIIMPLWLKLNFALFEMNQHWLIVSCILTFCNFSKQKFIQQHLEYVALVINHYSHSEITNLRSFYIIFFTVLLLLTWILLSPSRIIYLQVLFTDAFLLIYFSSYFYLYCFFKLMTLLRLRCVEQHVLLGVMIPVAEYWITYYSLRPISGFTEQGCF